MRGFEERVMAQAAQDIRIDQDPGHYNRMFDRQTGLPRWPLLLDRASIALARANRCDRVVAVFVIEDPRGFDGTVPDFADLAERLQSWVRPDDTVARPAHRTFVVVCNEIARDQDAAAVARRLVQSSGVLCKLGVALGGPDDSAQSLIERALGEAGRTFND
jgi:diguanylate cyclase with GGDEF domain